MPIRLKRPHKRLGGFLAAAGSWLELQEKATAPSERHRHPPRGGDSLHGVRQRVRSSAMLQMQRGFGEEPGVARGREVPRAQGVRDLPELLPVPGTSLHIAPGCRARG